MATLDLENQLVTVIVLFKVKAGQQAALLEQIKQVLAIAKQQPGFVSSNLHRSLDGLKVANYAQWESETALEHFRQLSEAQALVATLSPSRLRCRLDETKPGCCFAIASTCL
ncbi:MAG: antibiotic biosynthesis monooxygenase family protein, partial [Cyanobacteria bacterium J06635_11]